MELTQKAKGDITMSYRQAADKTKQIKILSELHLISRTVVCAVLQESGINDKVIEKMTAKPRKGKSPGDRAWTAEEEDRAVKLFINGASYKEIAEAVGRSYNSVRLQITGAY